MHQAVHQYIQNRTFDEIAIGETAQLVRTLRPDDIHLFAVMSGDVNPTHVDPEFARSGQFREVVGHSMWGSTLISSLLGTEFPGPGTVYVSQTLAFWRPVTIGDTLTVQLEVLEKQPKGRVRLATRVFNQNQEQVVDGEAEVLAPRAEQTLDMPEMPKVSVG